MGIDIDKIDFTDNDYRQFQHKLDEQLTCLKSLISDPSFGQAAPSLGAELELYIVDRQGRPLSINESILKDANNPLLTPELNSFNLEFNLLPSTLDASPFMTLEKSIVEQLATLNAIAATYGGRMVPIGILPTLKKDDFGIQCMTQRKRYYALLKQLIRKRGSKFHIDINGQEPLQYLVSDSTLEGANTSFQVHYQVTPQAYADTYNAIQLTTPLAIALGANSPTLFGHRLWHETRVPLFKQSIDTRHLDRYAWNEAARVNFGNGWCREGAYELFKESVSLYPVLIPACDAAANVSANDTSQGKPAPELAELRLHQGTVWLWNRPVYDPADGGHLRIEMRALPSGPTAIDMLANAAFLIGLAEGYRPSINELLPSIPFQTAGYNFYRSAQFGLDAQIIWPEATTGYRRQAVAQVIEDNLSVAQQGLVTIGIESNEIKRYLSVIEQRLLKKQNGAAWQINTLKKLNQTLGKDESLHKMLELFIDNSMTNVPVSEWPIGAKI